MPPPYAVPDAGPVFASGSGSGGQQQMPLGYTQEHSPVADLAGSRWSSKTGAGAGAGSGSHSGSESSRWSHTAPSSPSTNPHGGFHPSSFGPNVPFTAAALGASGSISSSSLGMSISPPHWGTWGPSGSYVGSLGALGSSFGRERDRELEAKYVREFTCCGRQLGGLHELLEHYEEEHAHLAPDVRLAAITAAQTAAAALPARMGGGPGAIPTQAFAPPAAHSDVPTPPGMMDIEMDEPNHATSVTFMPQPQPLAAKVSMSNSPWATAFRPPVVTAPQGVTPSLLSYPPPAGSSASSRAGTPTAQDMEARALKKAQRKVERMAAQEEASASDAESDKRFVCPIEGCGKVYKQANGLKYHLTRSINSGHGNVAAMGGLAHWLAEKGNDAVS